jgi:2-(1,2-epoxy-1,2-dihydrophenyl)acetyl-CoA isomerase
MSASDPEVGDDLIVSVEDGVALVTLNRPDRLNALSFELIERLSDSVAALARDDGVGCVVLTGAGRGFCAGGDTKAGAERRAGGEAQPSMETRIERSTARLRRGMEAARLLHVMPKPTIAMINGPVAGAGIGLAGACDMRFAAASATFVSAFERIGASGDYGATWFWTRILGTARARELFLLGEKMTAEQACSIGAYNRLYTDEDLRPETLKAARKIAGGPRATWRYMKANLNMAMDSDLARSLDAEALNMVLSTTAYFSNLKKEAG